MNLAKGKQSIEGYQLGKLSDSAFKSTSINVEFEHMLEE